MRLRNCRAEEFSDRIGDKKVICFGAGSTLIEAEYEILKVEGLERYIAFFIDNNPDKQGLRFRYKGKEFDIKCPDVLENIETEKYVILITCIYYVEIFQQLNMIDAVRDMDCYMYNCICSYPELDVEHFFSHEIQKRPCREYRNILEKLNLKDKYKGKRCFIIGNGPSLSIEDLECLNDEITFAANRIYALFNKTHWRPTYYFIIDYLIYGLDHKIIKDIDAQRRFVPVERALASGKIYKEMTYYNRTVNCTRIVDNEIVRSKDFNFSLDITDCVFGGQSVTYDMLQFAVYMGFSEINLLGMDHCFPIVVEEDGTIVKREGLKNHFSEEYDKGFGKNVAVVAPVYAATAAYEKANIIAKELGIKIRNLTRGGELEVFERMDFDELFPKKPKAILFGAGGGGKRLLSDVLSKYEIIFFVDNDNRKWGKTLEGYSIKEPREIIENKEYDYVIISSAPGVHTIEQQLADMGVKKNRIITDFVDLPLQVRNTYLKNLSQLTGDTTGVLAEAGVFQGEFAKVINETFPDKKLYLFDTFEGFDKRDIAIEQTNSYSEATVNDYELSSVELVMSKMKYPEKCIIKKGYFPETAKDIDEKFCFVNLDLDLYLPTLEGLKWFSKRMTANGVILVHDYFTENFRGVCQAVTEFMELEESNKYVLQPIGDGISVAITGFGG